MKYEPNSIQKRQHENIELRGRHSMTSAQHLPITHELFGKRISKPKQKAKTKITRLNGYLAVVSHHQILLEVNWEGYARMRASVIGD